MQLQSLHSICMTAITTKVLAVSNPHETIADYLIAGI